MAAWADGRETAAESRSQALVHLGECRKCRRLALDRDPSLLFLLSPGEETSDAETEAVRSTVQALRRARELERAAVARPARRRWAAAAGFLLVLLLVPRGAGRLSLAPPSEVAAERSGGGLAGGFAATDPDSLPALEGIDRPLARIYQLNEAGLSLVMVVDETLDV